jgi:hypothetical protein
MRPVSRKKIFVTGSLALKLHNGAFSLLMQSGFERARLSAATDAAKLRQHRNALLRVG